MLMETTTRAITALLKPWIKYVQSCSPANHGHNRHGPPTPKNGSLQLGRYRARHENNWLLVYMHTYLLELRAECAPHICIYVYFVVVFIRYMYNCWKPSTRNYKDVFTHTVAACEETSSLCLAPPVAVNLQVSSISVTGKWYLQMFGCIH